MVRSALQKCRLDGWPSPSRSVTRSIANESRSGLTKKISQVFGTQSFLQEKRSVVTPNHRQSYKTVALRVRNVVVVQGYENLAELEKFSSKFSGAFYVIPTAKYRLCECDLR